MGDVMYDGVPLNFCGGPDGVAHETDLSKKDSSALPFLMGNPDAHPPPRNRLRMDDVMSDEDGMRNLLKKAQADKEEQMLFGPVPGGQQKRGKSFLGPLVSSSSSSFHAPRRTPGSCSALVDSGTSLITAPSELAGEIAGVVNVAQDCGNYDALHNMTLVFRGENGSPFQLDLSPRDYVVEEMEGKKRESCALGIAPMDNHWNHEEPGLQHQRQGWILGDVFMRAFFTVFDMNNSA